MNEAADFEAARQAAIEYLAAMPRTEQEVRRYLQRRRCPPETVEEVLQSLRRGGLVDDRAYAREWVESRSRTRHLGRIRLEAELRTRGIEKAVIREALAILDPQQELENARTLARQFLGLQDPADAAVRRRLAGYLSRRGHAWDTIEKVLLELLAKD